MHPRRALSRERFILALACSIATPGCLHSLPPDMPDESNAKAVESPPPKPAVVSYSHEPAASPSSPSITKVAREHNYLLEFGNYQVEIAPHDGARIVAMRLDGRNALLERSASPEAYGSSFWPSPQSAWRWPPPYEFDRLGWEASVEGERLVLESRTNEALGLSAKQVLSAELEREALRIEYTLDNHGKKPVRVAPWQNTRVPPGGLTFFASEQGSLAPSTLVLRPVEGIVWMQHDAATAQEGKAFADGQEGWLAHLGGDLLLVKVFADVPREKQAPEEAEIEIYVHGGGRFVEVEQQGEYGELAPGAHSSWLVHWLVRRLPDSVPRQASKELVDYARGLAASVRAPK